MTAKFSSVEYTAHERRSDEKGGNRSIFLQEFLISSSLTNKPRAFYVVLLFWNPCS